MSCLLTKNTVFNFCALPGIPCANLLISFPYECCHVFLYCRCLLSCLYSNNMSMSSSTIALAKSIILFFLLFLGMIGHSLRENYSCMMDHVAILDLILVAGLVCTCWGMSSSSSWEMMRGLWLWVWAHNNIFSSILWVHGKWPLWFFDILLFTVWVCCSMYLPFLRHIYTPLYAGCVVSWVNFAS